MTRFEQIGNRGRRHFGIGIQLDWRSEGNSLRTISISASRKSREIAKHKLGLELFQLYSVIRNVHEAIQPRFAAKKCLLSRQLVPPPFPIARPQSKANRFSFHPIFTLFHDPPSPLSSPLSVCYQHSYVLSAHLPN